ncbi:MAG: methyltransferase [Acidimicrobiales bacterium]
MTTTGQLPAGSMGRVDGDDPWAALASSFVDVHSPSLKGVVRAHVLHQQLLEHLPPPPAGIVDVGGGAGNQSLPLARLGYELTIADPSAAMLARAEQRLAGEAPEVRQRVHLVHVGGEEAPAVLGEGRFDGALCHGVVMYLEDPSPLVDALCTLTAPGGVVSIVALNARTLAVRPALEGRWAAALTAFDSRAEVGVLGTPTRADTVDELADLLDRGGVTQSGWYGVWLFTDGWNAGLPPDDLLADVLAVELEASRRDPYRQLSRLFHLVGRKGEPDRAPAGGGIRPIATGPLPPAQESDIT